jgi:hypothetical protein
MSVRSRHEITSGHEESAAIGTADSFSTTNSEAAPPSGR